MNKYKVICVKGGIETELIGYTDDPNAFSLVSKWLKDNNIKNPYIRAWRLYGVTHVDYGSHTNFINVKEMLK